MYNFLYIGLILLLLTFLIIERVLLVKKLNADFTKKIQKQSQSFGISYIVPKGDAGFFSCCSQRLSSIINHINKYKKFPDIVDSSNQFSDYKYNNYEGDLATEFFDFDKSIKSNFSTEINITDEKNEAQFTDYKKFNFDVLDILIKKYFSPSKLIKQKIKNIENNYKLKHEKLLTVYYRATDKKSETNIPSIKTFLQKIEDLKSKNLEHKILLLSDDHKIKKIMKKKYKELIIIQELEKNHHRGYDHALYLLSIIISLSKSDIIVTTSGNVSQWLIFYRNNNKNIYQYLSHSKYINGVKNNFYNSNKKTFWL